jgi:hypothetical protein
MGDGCGLRPGSALAAWLLAAWLLCWTVQPTLAEDGCQPWPGEPIPLPTLDEVNPALARWSELRVAELVARAQLEEDRDPVESHRLWSRVLCFDPANELASRGVDRTRLVRVHRPTLRWGRARGGVVADPWEGLASSVSVPRHVLAGEGQRAGPSALALQFRSAALAEAESMAASGESSLREARFEEALRRGADARRLLDALPDDEAGRSLRTRVEVLSATAQIALGDEDAARSSFTRALASDPELRLDPMKTSPKVIQMLQDARGEVGP